MVGQDAFENVPAGGMPMENVYSAQQYVSLRLLYLKYFAWTILPPAQKAGECVQYMAGQENLRLS